MRKVLGKCLSAYLIIYLAFGAVFTGADEDYWGDFDSSAPFTAPEPQPEFDPQPDFQHFDSTPAEPQYYDNAVEVPQPQYHESAAEEQPQYYDTPAEPQYEPPPYEPSYQPHYADEPLESFDSFFSSGTGTQEVGSKYVKVIRSDRLYESVFQDAIIEGLQFSTSPTGVEDEIMVSCYFIFRDRPTSYFYDLNRKDKKLIFEFADARTGTSPVRADEQSPVMGVTIEELQVDANKEIKGLNPEWHNYIRITMDLSHIPIVSVSDESSIVSFSYKWTTNPEKYPLYVETNKFPLVFWLSAGGLGALGLGLLTYFLIPKGGKTDNSLDTGDLPCRPGEKCYK